MLNLTNLTKRRAGDSHLETCCSHVDVIWCSEVDAALVGQPGFERLVGMGKYLSCLSVFDYVEGKMEDTGARTS